MSTPVTLECYAEMRAEMDAGRLRDEVLARTGMTTDEWTDAQRGWLERMGTELERGRFELTNRYTHAFLERQRVLQTGAPPPLAAAAAPLPPAKTAPMPPIVAPKSLPFAKLPPPRAPASPITPPPIAAIRPEVHLPEVVKTADDSCQTLTAPLAPHAVVRGVLPFTNNQQDPNESSITPLVPRVAVLHQVLPFQKSQLNPNNTNPVAAPTDFDATATMPLDLGRLVHKDALPFKDGSEASHSTPHGKQETTAPEWERTPPSTVPSVILRDRPSLPFVMPAEAPREASKKPSPHHQSAPRPSGGALPFGPGATPAPPPEQTRPSVGLSSQQSLDAMKRAHSISLAQYAEICASVTTFPERIVEIRSHYEMDVQAWTTLHELWQERFQRDPMLQPRWEALVEAAFVASSAVSRMRSLETTLSSRCPHRRPN